MSHFYKVLTYFIGLLLFLAPFFNGQKILDIYDIFQVDWCFLLLFGTGINLLAISFALACRSAFMFTVATLPNAIVIGTPKVAKLTNDNSEG